MFDAISCFISGNKIEVHGKTFLLGELSADILGITPVEYVKMREASERIETLLQQDNSGETLFAMRVETGLLALTSHQAQAVSNTGFAGNGRRGRLP